MVMTSRLRFLQINTICILTISNLDLLLFLLNFLLYIISIRSWFNKKTHRLLRWVLFAKSSGGRVLLLTGTEDSGFQIIREKGWRCKEADGTKRLKMSDLRKFPSQGSRLKVFFYFWSSGFTSFNGIIYSSPPPCKVSGQPYRWTLYLHWLSVCHNLQSLFQHHPPRLSMPSALNWNQRETPFW